MTKTQRRALLRLRAELTMADAGFGLGPSGVVETNSPLPTNEREVTDFIRRRTLIWRNTWIFPVLEALLDNAPASQLEQIIG